MAGVEPGRNEWSVKKPCFYGKAGEGVVARGRCGAERLAVVQNELPMDKSCPELRMGAGTGGGRRARHEAGAVSGLGDRQDRAEHGVGGGAFAKGFWSPGQGARTSSQGG